MKTSVVMTSYNGENYIYEQMSSIYGQTLQPDEVIIFDDCSKDKTVSVIENFIKSHNLENWHLVVNSENKGWMRNFVEALRKTQGEYIFFSDQDDIWYKDKIEVMVRQMEVCPEILCLTGKVTTINGSGAVLKGRNDFSTENDLGSLIKYSFSPSFNTVIMPGCSMCITKKIANIILDIGIKNCPYDVQCCRLGILLDGTYALNTPVIHHRIHEHNTSNFMTGVSFGSSNLKRRIDSIEKNIIWLERLLGNPELQNLLSKERKMYIKKTILFQNERLKFLSSKNIFYYVKLYKFKEYYSGLPMYFGDFSYAFNINRTTGKILNSLKKLKAASIHVLKSVI